MCDVACRWLSLSRPKCTLPSPSSSPEGPTGVSWFIGRSRPARRVCALAARLLAWLAALLATSHTRRDDFTNISFWYHTSDCPVGPPRQSRVGGAAGSLSLSLQVQSENHLQPWTEGPYSLPAYLPCLVRLCGGEGPSKKGAALLLG